MSIADDGHQFHVADTRHTTVRLDIERNTTSVALIDGFQNVTLRGAWIAAHQDDRFVEVHLNTTDMRALRAHLDRQLAGIDR